LGIGGTLAAHRRKSRLRSLARSTAARRATIGAVTGPCQHYYRASLGGESAFAIDPSAVVFGRGALRELGAHAKAAGLSRVTLFTDAQLRALPLFETATASLRAADVDFAVFDAVRIEPSDVSVLEAARFAAEGRFDGYVSLGGGSVIDTTKLAALLATYPAELLRYVNAPVGEGRAVPGALPPHIACPTTSGTGSECTGIAIFDLSARHAKTGIASRRLRPSLALVDPDVTRTLPASVIASSGFDVLCHAIESYTARPYTARAPTLPSARPMSQGANPWSDLGSLEALRIASRYLVRAADDASDDEARESMMWAATLAGIAFGNSGVHVPHGMAYAIAGLAPRYQAPGYPSDHPLVPHGISVVLGAPSVVRLLARVAPQRHLEAARALGLAVTHADDAGDALAEGLLALMRACSLPVTLAEVGYSRADLDALVDVTLMQQRLLENAPRTIGRDDLMQLFSAFL